MLDPAVTTSVLLPDPLAMHLLSALLVSLPERGSNERVLFFYTVFFFFIFYTLVCTCFYSVFMSFVYCKKNKKLTKRLEKKNPKI